MIEIRGLRTLGSATPEFQSRNPSCPTLRVNGPNLGTAMPEFLGGGTRCRKNSSAIWSMHGFTACIEFILHRGRAHARARSLVARACMGGPRGGPDAMHAHLDYVHTGGGDW